MLSSEVGTIISAYCREEITVLAKTHKSTQAGTAIVYVVTPPVNYHPRVSHAEAGRTPILRGSRRFSWLIGGIVAMALFASVQLIGYKEVKPVQVKTTTEATTSTKPNTILQGPKSRKCSAYHLWLHSGPLKLKEISTVSFTMDVGACLELYSDEEDNIYAFRAFFEDPREKEFEIFE